MSRLWSDQRLWSSAVTGRRRRGFSGVQQKLRICETVDRESLRGLRIRVDVKNVRIETGEDEWNCGSRGLVEKTKPRSEKRRR
nr:hypothetical protein Iba_scaffold46650CG0030 [Ipomoea batatas]GMD48840.1 hypothetical protein Iba_scaffold46650CG0050 [Ipomoea batatas]